jgi:hypothetical protein
MNGASIQVLGCNREGGLADRQLYHRTYFTRRFGGSSPLAKTGTAVMVFLVFGLGVDGAGRLLGKALHLHVLGIELPTPLGLGQLGALIRDEADVGTGDR